MEQALKKAIIEYLDSHRHGALATVCEDGSAHVSTVSYDIIPFLKISPAKIDYLDYSKGFNHWDTLEI